MNGWKAVVSAAIVMAVNIAAMFGVTLDPDLTRELVCSFAMIAATAWGLWRNHNFTKAAQEGQDLVDAIKADDKAAREHDDYYGRL